MTKKLSSNVSENSNQSAIFIIDLAPPYIILEFNRSFKHLTGYSSKDITLSNQTLESIVYPEDFSKLINNISYQLSVSNLTNDQFRIVRKNGDIISVLCNGQIYALNDGRNVLQFVLTDITNLESAALETKQAKSDLVSFAKSVPSGLSKHLCDSDLSVIWANDYFYEIAGYTPSEWMDILNNNTYSLIYSEDLPIVVTSIADLVETGEYQVTFRVLCKDGTIKWVNAIGAKSEEVINNYPVINLVLSDVTALKITEMKAELEEKKYQIISDISEEIPYEYELDSDVITYAQKYSYTFGRKSIIKHPRQRLVKLGAISSDTTDAFEGLFEAARRGDAMHSAEYKLQTKNGDYEWYYSTFSAIKNPNGATTRVVGVLRNINQQKIEQLRLLNKSEQDAMTGLFNKITTELKVQEHLKSLNSTGVIMILDIDDFKNINDTYGHLIGDEVIIEIANAMKHFSTGYDIAGRIGGDEFLLYLNNVLDMKFACEKAEKIANRVRSRFPGNDGNCKVTLSIGIAATNSPIPYTTFIENADNALYQSKSKGKNCYTVFKEDDVRSEYHNDRTSMANANNELLGNVYDTLYYSSSLSDGIENAIAYIGKNKSIDRICVWEYEFDRSYLSRTHEWKRNPNASYETLSNHPASRLFEEIEGMSSNGIFHSNNTANLSINSNYQNIMSNIADVLTVTIYHGTTPVGYVGFINYNGSITWDTETIFLLTLLGKNISDYVRRNMGLYELDNLFNDTISLLNSASVPTYVINRDNYEIIHYNDAFKDAYKDVALGKKCYSTVCNASQSCKDCPLLQLSNDKKYATSTISIEGKKNKFDVTASTIKWINYPNSCVVNIKPHEASEGEILSANMDERNNLEKKFAREAFKDSLTGYSNFDGFTLKVQEILDNNPDNKYALYYINVKNFKLINEAFGHNIGNKTLKQIAEVFNKYTREDEAFARVISDTFVIFKRHNTRNGQIATFAAITDEIKRSCALIQDKYAIDFSAGIIVLDEDNRDLSINTLIDRVIIAIRNNPDKPGTNYTFYKDDLRKEYIYQANLENNMYTALAKGEFLPYLQPKFDITTKKIIGSEALVRWVSPNNGFMFPDSFIPIFEKNGFIAEIDLYMLEEVCKTLRTYIMNNYPIYPCSVNLSRVTLNHPDLVRRIKVIVEEYRIPTEYIEFEVTENVFVSDHQSIISTLNELKSMGFSISMDDFGSGYSSLILLKDLPIDVLKLDKQFLDADTTNPNTYHIMKSIVDMSKSLNIKVVCEGVETEKQATFLKDIGCDIGQGYLFAKPMPVEDYSQLLKKGHRFFKKSK